MENWKIIQANRNYEVSTEGRIRNATNKKILSQSVNHKGYRKVSLFENGRAKNFFVHRLVAIAFIENPNNLEQVNHKDEDKANNFVENLEWCSPIYNIRYGSGIKRKAISRTRKTKIMQISTTGNNIATYRSFAQANKAIGARYRDSKISECCKGKRKTAYGFVWQEISANDSETQLSLRKKGVGG